MIKSVTVINHLNDSIKMELRKPEKSGFLIKKIEGLGPADANINVTEFTTNDGAVFTSARLLKRNIVFSLALLDKPTIEDVRLLSYKMFPVKKNVTLIFETDNRLCEITGYVESNKPDIFSASETIQVSIICPDPYFYNYGENSINVTAFNAIESHFEFPFSNESLTENLIEFSTISQSTRKNVVYAGDVETGIVISIHAIGEASNISFFNAETHGAIRIDTAKLKELTGSGIVYGDEITISTIKRQKSITLLRDGVYTNILNCVNRDAEWFQLSRGDNVFAYSVESGLSNLQISMSHRLVYEGI